MNRIAGIIMIALFGFACDGEVKVNEAKLDTAAPRLQKSVKEGVDSIGKLDRLEGKPDKDETLKSKTGW